MPARDRLKDLPDLAAGASNLVEWARAVAESIQTLRGLRGNPLDKAITKRDAANGALDGVVVVSGAPGGSGATPPPGIYEPVYVEDLTPPPTPTGLNVIPGFTKIIVQCDPQTYTQGHGHNRTNVYGAKWPQSGATPPTFSEAVRLWSFLGTIDSYATDPSTRWCIWVKWQSMDGVESMSPAGDPLGGPHGFQVTTGVDIPLVLDALAGQITESQLATSLSAPISLVTAASTVPGSVNARIKAEETQRISGDANTLSSAQSYVGLFTYSKSSIDGSLAATSSNLTAAFQQADITLRALAQLDTASYAYSLSNGTALAGQVLNLSASVASPTISNNPTYAALQTESSARATLDGNVRSLYTVRTEVSSDGRTLMGGFGLAGTAGGPAGPSIDFGVVANRFWVGAPAGSGLADKQFFTIQTTNWNDNGVTRPPGLYVDAAFIANLSATYATIGTLVADQIAASDISVSKLTAGTFRVGEHMRSTGFVSGPGGNGWRMDGSGYLEASGVTIRGTIFATAGLFSGTVKVGSNPTISGTTMTGSGAVINADGTFALGTAAGNITYNGTGAPVLNGFETPVATLSTYAANFQADSAGLVDGGQSFPVALIVRRGASEEASLWTFAVSGRSDASITTSGSGSTLNITGMGTAVDSGWIEFTASRSGNATQGPMRVSVSKTKRPASNDGPVALFGVFDSDAFSFSPADASAFITLKTDGSIWAGAGAGAKVGDWRIPNSSGVGAGFAVRFDELASSGPTDGLSGVALGAWHQINVDRTVSLTTTENVDLLRVRTLAIATRNHTTGIQTGSGTVHIRAEVAT